MILGSGIDARRKLPGNVRDAGTPSLLLVGENCRAPSDLANRLQQRGYQCKFAATYEELRSLLKTEEISLVLSPTRLRGRNLLPLIDLLEGSNVSLLYAQSVEAGSWWLPALRHGRNCFGSCAVRPSEFISVLDELTAKARSNERTNAGALLPRLNPASPPP